MVNPFQDGLRTHRSNHTLHGAPIRIWFGTVSSNELMDKPTKIAICWSITPRFLTGHLSNVPNPFNRRFRLPKPAYLLVLCLA